MSTKRAEIIDIFSSIQGEGIFAGAKQVFVRFKACNMRCAYCDEPRDTTSRVISPLQAITEIRFLEETKGVHHSVSLTGGEPLLYSDFLAPFLKILKKEAKKTYLETNGTLPEELSKVVDLVDIIAMDFKLPSATGARSYWDEHLSFLKIAAKKNVFVKAVVTSHTKKEDIERSISLIKSVDKTIPLILQPATPVGPADEHVKSQMLMSFLDIAVQNSLESVRAIPQVHKILGVK